MKGWSFKVANVGGTEVRIHVTFLLLLAYFGFVGAQTRGPQGAILEVAFLCAMFLCVLLHEFGHVLAARRYGIQTPDITLLPIGGVARLERMPRVPFQELIVAICGPLVNVVICVLILFLIRVLRGGLPARIDMSFVGGDFLGRLAAWNLLMVLFNMIPAFPMDGGRVLRALLAMITDYTRATRMAATLGQTIAAATFLALLFLRPDPFLMIIAVFIFFIAGQEAATVTEQEAVQGLRVRDAMQTEFHVLKENDSLRDAIDLMLAGTQHDFPMINDAGEFGGLLTRTSLISALAEHGAGLRVHQAAQPCDSPVSPTDELSSVLPKLQIAPCGMLPVIEPANGRLVGLLTTENVGELLMVRTALTQARAVAA